MDNMDVANNIRRRREKLGKTIQEVADNAGISRETLSRIEHGRSPRIETLDLLAKALGVDVNQLIGDET